MSAAEEQSTQTHGQSAIEMGSLSGNHSTMNDLGREGSEPKNVDCNDLADLSKGTRANSFLMGESSDSEGPLPEIDIGFSSEEESAEET